jgi:hypothetical protein
LPPAADGEIRTLEEAGIGAGQEAMFVEPLGRRMQQIDEHVVLHGCNDSTESLV